MMNDEAIYSLFMPFFDEINNLATTDIGYRPLLAHYTSIDVLEKIISSEEIWFSNPLFMNDTQELSFGVTEGLKEFDALKENGVLATACGSAERFKVFTDGFDYYLSQFNNNALDIYVFCLSRHENEDNQGRLSMWRGYGENGNGAAIVFNTHLLKHDNNSPLLFAKIDYVSDEDRKNTIKQRLIRAISVISDNKINDNQLHIAAYMIIQLIVTYSLTEKNLAFAEEHEWRVIYLPNWDVNGIFKDDYHYIVTKNGIEPKLKVKLKPMRLQETVNWQFNDLINRIIIGPSGSSWVTYVTIKRMLTLNKKENLNLVSSTIPFRQSR